MIYFVCCGVGLLGMLIAFVIDWRSGFPHTDFLAPAALLFVVLMDCIGAVALLNGWPQ